MNILILGAGLLGVSTAYELGKRGFNVTVLERQPECAAEGSYSNGAQLSYSHAEPWASHFILPKLPFWLLNPKAPLIFSPRADWHMNKWIAGFLRNCTPARARRNCLTILRLGLYSKQEYARIRKETGIEFSFSDNGILRIYTTQADFDHAKKHSAFQAKFGCTERILSRDQCITLEPSLEHSSGTIVGGIHAIMDEVGDAYEYCHALEKVAETKYGVKFIYGANIQELLEKDGKITSVTTDKETYEADSFVMAMGPHSPIFLRQVGIDTSIYPMKGYSITMEANEFCPISSITDNSHKIVLTRIGNRLRVAGTAELSGYNNGINMKRVTPIIDAAKELLPKANWDQEIQSWACLRPTTPDGPPLLGKTPYSNLFLNTGHGTLGWTQAAGSASIVADIIEGNEPQINMNGLTLR
ncbi:MAG: D-amino acid dehydrogenase [Rickettsiales bacterium]